MRNLRTEDQTARACLEQFLDIFIDDLRGMMKIAPVIYEFYALAFHNKTIRLAMQRYLETFVGLIEPIVQHGIDTGEFRHVDARQVTIAIGVQLDGTLLYWGYAPNSMSLEEQLRAGTTLLLDSITITPS